MTEYSLEEFKLWLTENGENYEELLSKTSYFIPCPPTLNDTAFSHYKGYSTSLNLSEVDKKLLDYLSSFKVERERERESK